MVSSSIHCLNILSVMIIMRPVMSTVILADVCIFIYDCIVNESMARFVKPL